MTDRERDRVAYNKSNKKKKTFFSAAEETRYDRELELNFFSRYYRELCLTVMGLCLLTFGLSMTVIAAYKGVSDLFIIGPPTLVIGLIMLVMASGFSINRFINRPRTGIHLDFVEAPPEDKLFLKKTSVASPGVSSNEKKQYKSCLRQVPKDAVNSIEVDHKTPASPGREKSISYTEFPASPICTLPEVGGHDGESVRSTPENNPCATLCDTIEDDPYPPQTALTNASPIDVLPPAQYTTPL